MRRFLFIAPCVAMLCIPHTAAAMHTILCAGPEGGLHCFAASDPTSDNESLHRAIEACEKYFGAGSNYCHLTYRSHDFTDRCAAAAMSREQGPFMLGGENATQAQTIVMNYCIAHSATSTSCTPILTICDPPLQMPSPVATVPQPPSAPVPLQPATPPPCPQVIQQIIYSSNSFAAAAIGFAIAILFAIGLVFRHAISNFVIHGNLPYKLPVYGEDIQCLIKRTQRVNWYGRVVFGIIVNLAMTHQQLIDVRKYWLGRVIAFDSLRRQRQNELARMHLQLAASVKSDPHDKKKFWSRRWATFRTFIRRLFWIFTALFSFLFGFLFIRITIAKMVQGTVIESNDLVLILQAKDAIEESTTYLKEYLTTANTFDGGDEIYEPQ
jgi:hypothetical protein